ncbi:hypothetical protein L9F63_020571, partial [Diploptera punctata]
YTWPHTRMISLAGFTGRTLPYSSPIKIFFYTAKNFYIRNSTYSYLSVHILKRIFLTAERRQRRISFTVGRCEECKWINVPSRESYSQPLNEVKTRPTDVGHGGEETNH